jgi:plasmid stabilization system protein ParE
VAQVRLSALAVESLERMIVTHSLPANTKARVARAVEPLSRFPRMGRKLEGGWSPFRVILGSWRWLLIVYAYDEDDDVVVVVTFQDARSSSAASST